MGRSTVASSAERASLLHTLLGRRLTYRGRQQIWGFVFALPAVILFAVFAIYPILQTFYLSFFDYNMVNTPEFVGLANYQTILGGSVFRDSISFTFFYTIGTYVPTLIIALLLALVLNTKVRLRGFWRMMNFIPVVISWVVVSVVWKLIFHRNGLFNAGLDSMGIFTPDWLLSTAYAPYAIIIPSIWKEIGFYMVIFLAGLQNIPGVYYEASKIDGASIWQSFRFITLPLLRPTITLAIVVALINGLKIFIPPFVMTQGGPAGSTRVMSLIIYQTAFANGRLGRASAMAVILFLVILLFTVLQNRLYGTRRDDA
jgi:ABC-type sugar transport system permease subunit